MSTQIYYFSGTGNSIFVAKELQKRIADSEIISIVSMLSNDSLNIKGDKIGFVFPVHALTIPIVVKEFIKKANFEADYFFAIATREGTVFRGFVEIDHLLHKKGKRLNSRVVISMFSNDARQKNYRKPTEAEVLSMEKKVEEELTIQTEIIEMKRDLSNMDISYTINCSSNPLANFLLEKLVIYGMDISKYVGGVNYYYTSDNCIGCGTCENVCLSQKIKLVDKKPIWQKDVLCFMCYACLNYCPVKAVQVKSIIGVVSYTEENTRYSHPFATINDIASQKSGKNK